jgi:hypothetical protein
LVRPRNRETKNLKRGYRISLISSGRHNEGKQRNNYAKALFVTKKHQDQPAAAAESAKTDEPETLRSKAFWQPNKPRIIEQIAQIIVRKIG